MKYIDKAKALISKMMEAQKAERALQLSAADWRIIGKALEEGRALHKSDQKFAKWKRDNGFGHLTLHQSSEALWLANDEHWAFYKGEQNWHVREARKAWNATHQDENRSKGQVVIEALQDMPKRTGTTKELEEITGLPSRDIADVCYQQGKVGKIIRVKKGTYRLPKRGEVAEPKPQENKPSGISYAELRRPVKVWDIVKRGMKIDGKPIYPRFRDPVEVGTVHTFISPMPGIETWKEAANGTGKAKGYMMRVIVEPIEVDVNKRGESLEKTTRILDEWPE